MIALWPVLVFIANKKEPFRKKVRFSLYGPLTGAAAALLMLTPNSAGIT